MESRGHHWKKKRMSNVHQGTQNVQGRSSQCFKGGQPSAIIGVPDEMLEYSAETWSLDISLMDIGHSALYFSDPGPPLLQCRVCGHSRGPCSTLDIRFSYPAIINAAAGSRALRGFRGRQDAKRPCRSAGGKSWAPTRTCRRRNRPPRRPPAPAC